MVAGRDERRAEALCRELRHGARGRRLDTSDASALGPALEGVGAVIACVAQRELHLLRASVTRGLVYTDIAPRLAFWQMAETMNEEARRTGARIVLGAGLSPGISNMMAAKLAKELGSVDGIETAILLTLGDEYGPDSLHHVFEAMSRHQADATATAAAEFARALASGEVDQAGVWLPEQVISPERFFASLATLGWVPSVEEVAARS